MSIKESNMDNEIKLTLDPNAALGAAAAQPAPAAPDPLAAAAAAMAKTAAEGQKEEKPSGPAIDESMFNEAERRAIDDFSKQIDITDSSMILSYGSAAQKKISDFSDTALGSVRNKDFGEVGGMITSLIGNLRSLNDDADSKGFLGLFKNTKRKIENLKTQYDKCETSVNQIVGILEQHQITLLKDVSMFDQLYEMNLSYFKELSMYILAGKKRLAEERAVTLVELKNKAQQSGLPEDAQAANDFEEQCTRFERKLYDLELTRMVSIQMSPQIRLVQNNDTMMTEKIQTVIMNTIPLWKSQMVIALGIEHSRQAMEAGRLVTDMTNELLKKNSEALHQATVAVTKEAERGIVDIETLTHTNEELIATLNDIQQIQKEGREKRVAAEAELGRIETELKEKLINITKS
ncbi:MAG: toxic anion resistance protein [Clostridia bacterium]|nr:toxic anion resistance protein [Clostridia bacterium]